MNWRKRNKVILLAGVALISACIAGYFALGYHVRAKVQRSAMDILILESALELKCNFMGGGPHYPDYAFQSPAMRLLYGIPDDVPQELVEQLEGETDNTVINKALTDQGFKYKSTKYMMRLNQWQGVVQPINYIRDAHYLVRHRRTIDGTFGFSHLEAAITKEESGFWRRWFGKWLKPVYPLPRDPFGPDSGGSLYRYGLSPNKTLRKYGDGYWHMWLIVGNGPDGDADVDVEQFRIAADGAPVVWQWEDAREGPVAERTYDPSNGTSSNGDIVLINHDPALTGTHKEFRARHGL